jgi:rhodanese-related sulfurtransferase
MDGNPQPVSPSDLYGALGTQLAPVLIDVRRHDSFIADDRLIIGAFHHAPADVESWRKGLPAGRPVVAYCGHGGASSQSVASALRGAGVHASHLEGGISGWKERGLPTRRKLGAAESKWVTREHPKIDRIACPWLIRRFINPLAEFIYVPASEVLAVAEEKRATPYDIKGAEFGHVGDRCSFDAIIRIFEIKDPALDRLATIVRGADTSRPDLAPQCEGLLAISYGLSANYPDDHEMLRHGMIIYDALYRWCRLQSAAQVPVAKATA